MTHTGNYKFVIENEDGTAEIITRATIYNIEPLDKFYTIKVEAPMLGTFKLKFHNLDFDTKYLNVESTKISFNGKPSRIVRAKFD